MQTYLLRAYTSELPDEQPRLERRISASDIPDASRQAIDLMLPDDKRVTIDLVEEPTEAFRTGHSQLDGDHRLG